ncbi:Serine-pyruvate aminotransferase protein [Salinisphaera shabanensis E1L3A]|uniref:Serine-pyruvate aminotransferase protein n=1 Tax=Salinisphaera shabanensis E1L3A TaxID=1033802 RepID=U2EID3_9GAMM|nr:aminotransferase class V-fold PLP-dependent enzyme [Salinisphaera shabanensis]ERJ18107.1 Serine-pyruvate aminotransferase protein [Salinisphaera shabanensis E1L3A]
MTQARSSVDPDGLLEYSVVYTDRSLNHMSSRFKHVLTSVSGVLKQVYNAHSAVIVPGSGTFGMEAVARQFAQQKHCLVIRNGWFSYRWTQILEMGAIPDATTVLSARREGDSAQAPFAPAPIAKVVETINTERPAVVFAPHVETSAGMLLPEDYLRAVADAVHAYGGLFVLDCIASGTHWIDMQACGIDILISAPQKGWSASPCCAMVMLSERARERIESTTSSSYACDLRKWLQIMETYEAGGHAYHATMPTDGLTRLLAMMEETRALGFDTARERQFALGHTVRDALQARGFESVAAPGFQASGVVVSYTRDPKIQSGARFVDAGVQIAAGVPLMCGEGDDFQSFRVGLFGLDKLYDVERCVSRFVEALDEVR